MGKILRNIGIGLAVFLFVLAAMLYLRFGGGDRYADITDEPILRKADVELFFSYDEPLGNVAATNDRSPRVFFTVHPESRPKGAKLLEIVDGNAVPYPSEADQSLFNNVLGLYCDNQNRLWTIDHGQHGTGKVKLLAFSLSTNTVVHEYVFPREIAERGSFFNDLSVTPDGLYVFVADVSFFGKRPSLVVYDVAAKEARSLLDGHPSVSDMGYVPVTPQKTMRFVGGLVDLMPGIDGLDVTKDGRYVYYAAMSRDGIYRVPVASCTDFSLTESKMDSLVNGSVERISDKPLSDGIRCDFNGNVYITDVEHQGFSILRPNGELETLIKDNRIRWADGASLGGDGKMYFTDSGIPDQMLRSRKHMKQAAPYGIFRFSVQTSGGKARLPRPNSDSNQDDLTAVEAGKVDSLLIDSTAVLESPVANPAVPAEVPESHDSHSAEEEHDSSTH